MSTKFSQEIEGLTPESEPYFDLASLERGLERSTTLVLDANELNLLERVRAFYREMKSFQRGVAEIYQPAGEWREHLIRRMPHYSAFEDENLERLADLLGNFWRNELGVLVKQYAGYPQLVADPSARTAYSAAMAYDLMVWDHLHRADPRELAISEVGNPWGYFWRGVLVGSKALRYHDLKTQIEGLCSDIESPVIAEIGAGYGGLAYFLMRGQAPRKYIDFDLPETLAVAAYHLTKSLPQHRVYLHPGGEPEWASILTQHDVILMPNWCIQSIPADSVDVFLNTFSLSEMSRPVVKEYLEKISRSCRNYFLHNNMDRSGVVNEGHERLPASDYPFPKRAFKLLSKRYDLFQRKHSGRDGDYREFLYQRVRAMNQA